MVECIGVEQVQVYLQPGIGVNVPRRQTTAFLPEKEMRAGVPNSVVAGPHIRDALRHPDETRVAVARAETPPLGPKVS